MIFKEVIGRELLDIFYISELSEEDSITMSYMDIVSSDDGKLDDLKKTIIRELRFHRLLDGVDTYDRIEKINKIVDTDVIHSKRSIELGFDGDFSKAFPDGKLLNASMRVSTYNVSLTDIISFSYGKSNGIGDKISEEVYRKINDKVEEIIISDYLELSELNSIKMEEFDRISPMVVDYNPTKIVAKINTASNYITKNNRKGRGNCIIINPIDYNKLGDKVELLNMNILKSIHIPKNKILVTVKSSGIEFHRFVYRLEISENDDYLDFRFKYGMDRTSVRPESNCLLISIV